MRRVSRLGWLRALIVCALFTASPGFALAGGPKLVIEVDEPFLLQGQVCPAGTVTVRYVSRYNPSSTLHRICAAGECLGVFRAEGVERGGGDEVDSVRFERNRNGELVMLGYTLRQGGKTAFFRFANSPNSSPELVANVASSTRSEVRWRPAGPW